MTAESKKELAYDTFSRMKPKLEEKVHKRFEVIDYIRKTGDAFGLSIKEIRDLLIDKDTSKELVELLTTLNKVEYCTYIAEESRSLIKKGLKEVWIHRSGVASFDDHPKNIDPELWEEREYLKAEMAESFNTDGKMSVTTYSNVSSLYNNNNPKIEIVIHKDSKDTIEKFKKVGDVNDNKLAQWHMETHYIKEDNLKISAKNAEIEEENRLNKTFKKLKPLKPHKKRPDLQPVRPMTIVPKDALPLETKTINEPSPQQVAKVIPQQQPVKWKTPEERSKRRDDLLKVIRKGIKKRKAQEALQKKLDLIKQKEEAQKAALEQERLAEEQRQAEIARLQKEAQDRYEKEMQAALAQKEQEEHRRKDEIAKLKKELAENDDLTKITEISQKMAELTKPVEVKMPEPPKPISQASIKPKKEKPKKEKPKPKPKKEKPKKTKEPKLKTPKIDKLPNADHKDPPVLLGAELPTRNQPAITPKKLTTVAHKYGEVKMTVSQYRPDFSKIKRIFQNYSENEDLIATIYSLGFPIGVIVILAMLLYFIVNSGRY